MFDRSAYLRMADGNFACVGGAQLVAGPINVCCDAWPDPVAAVLRPGMAVLVGGVRLPGRGCLVVNTGSARMWQPQPGVVAGSVATRRRLDSFRQAVGERAPAESLCGPALGASTADPVARVAAPAVRALSGWLAHCAAMPAPPAPPPAVSGLLGLGPGLTPSGDDLLAGVLVALAAWGRPAAARALGAGLDPLLAGATSEISAAHLRAAMQGEAVEPIHRCVAALTQDGGDPLAALEALAGYGHTSGWDALAGVLLVAGALSAR